MRLGFFLGLIFFLAGSAQHVYSQDATSVFNKSFESIVTIKTSSTNKLGSGFFVSKNLIVTNFHVVENEGSKTAVPIENVEVYLNSSSIRIKAVGYFKVDSQKDLAIIELNYSAGLPLKFSVTDASIGDKIFAVGSPLGLKGSISDGIVSGFRNINENDYLQITAPISPGSSGGPVLNYNAEIVGIAVANLPDGQNLNFAIPSKTLEMLLGIKAQIPFTKDTLITKNDLLISKKHDDQSGKIILLNGKEIPIASYTITPEKVNYIKTDDAKGKTHRIDKLKVFSVQPFNGLEDVIYSPDTITSDDPSVEEVRRFVMGEQHANKVYHNDLNKGVAGVMGLGSSVLSFYGGFVPALYSAAVGNFSPKQIIPANGISQEIFNSDEFRYGYQKRARTKKIQQGFLFGIAGFALGTTVLSIYENNK